MKVKDTFYVIGRIKKIKNMKNLIEKVKIVNWVISGIFIFMAFFQEKKDMLLFGLCFLLINQIINNYRTEKHKELFYVFSVISISIIVFGIITFIKNYIIK